MPENSITSPKLTNDQLPRSLQFRRTSTTKAEKRARVAEVVAHATANPEMPKAQLRAWAQAKYGISAAKAYDLLHTAWESLTGEKVRQR
jgi:hypothetical protein